MLRGIVPSLNTPFAEDGAVDLESLGRLVDHTVAAGAAGILCNAVAAEASSLTADERRQMLEVILERNAGRIPIIASVSADDIDQSKALAHEARAMGADAINWRAPPDLAGAALAQAVAAVADEGPDWFVLQDLDFAGPGLAVDDMLDLFEDLPRLKGVKVEGPFSGQKCSVLLARSEGRLNVMSGWPVTGMIDMFDRGVHGFMPTGLTATLVRLHRLHSTGHTEHARLLFERLLPLLAFASQHLFVSVRVNKMLSRAEGVFATDHCRPPIAELDPHMRRAAERLVARTLANVREIEVLGTA